MRESVISFCDACSSEACGRRGACFPSNCQGECVCDGACDCASCGKAFGQAIAGVGNGCCCFFHTVATVPNFLLGLVLITLCVCVGVWFALGRPSLVFLVPSPTSLAGGLIKKG